MGWANEARDALKQGREVQVRPMGGSMRGRIESGQPVTISPVDLAEIEPDDIVFIRWRGNFLLHLVKELRDGQVLIGNNLGKINGWAPIGDVLGKVTAVHADETSA